MGKVNIIEYITIATQGNAVDIGDLTVGRATVKHVHPLLEDFLVEVRIHHN